MRRDSAGMYGFMGSGARIERVSRSVEKEFGDLGV